MKVPWNAETAHAIGADWLLAEIAPSGAFGRLARARERPFLCGDESAASASLENVMFVARSVSPEAVAGVRAAICAAPDICEAIARARGGGTLDDVDFFEISRFTDALDELAYATSGAAFAGWRVAAVAAVRDALAVGRTRERTFYLADAFATALQSARGDAARAQAVYDAAYGRTVARIARALGRETLGSETFTLMRDAAPTPLPPGVRVVREAPTYLLCDVELDAAAHDALVARDAAFETVGVAEEAVRVDLSRAVARSAPELEIACERLGTLESFLARASFAQRHSCVVPEIVHESRVTIDAMRFLPLVGALARAGRTYQAPSFDVVGVAVVTGPNMGGKTAALRALGFASACLALGVPVPARAASLPLLDSIVWLGVGAAQGEESLLSAFGREVVDLRGFLEARPSRALVLLDEFARTTSPREGRALLVAVLETLRACGHVALAATHLAGIARAARVQHFALGARAHPLAAGERLDLDAALAEIARTTDYRLVAVRVEDAIETAEALDLAGALGLDPTLLARARDVLS